MWHLWPKYFSINIRCSGFENLIVYSYSWYNNFGKKIKFKLAFLWILKIYLNFPWFTHIFLSFFKKLAIVWLENALESKKLPLFTISNHLLTRNIKIWKTTSFYSFFLIFTFKNSSKYQKSAIIPHPRPQILYVSI